MSVFLRHVYSELIALYSNDNSFLGVSLLIISETLRDITQLIAAIDDRCQLSGLEKLLKQLLDIWFCSNRGMGIILLSGWGNSHLNLP